MTDYAELKPVAWRARRTGSSEWEVFGYDPRALKQFSFFEPLYSADTLSSLVRERDEALKVLRDHHKWHAESGALGIPDGDGGWIEMDNGAEYADSRLCQRTEAAISGMSPEVVVPPRGGWSMGSNHWENWQLAYRQKRAAEARATAAEAERDSWRRVSERLEGEKIAAEADAARMREALEQARHELWHLGLVIGQIAKWPRHYFNRVYIEEWVIRTAKIFERWGERERADEILAVTSSHTKTNERLEAARNALGGKDE